MRICIATGIYPPATSGPAQYAAAMEREFATRGHKVDVVTYKLENSLPTGIRHVLYFFRVLPRVYRADFVLALDTFSVGLPAVLAARLCGRKIIIRTGGDFLYEQFVQRTGEKILLSKFYSAMRAFSEKEHFIFALTRWTLRKASAVVFSTEWQRDIFMKPYRLSEQNIFVVENRFDEKISDEPARVKNFIFATRNIAYKNIDAFKNAFAIAQKNNPEISLEIYHTLAHNELMEKMKTCYAVVMPSLGEISPHVILDALRCNKPFLLSSESGYAEKLENIGVLVDPLSENDMAEKISWLAQSENYAQTQTHVRAYNFTHSWGQIADELLVTLAKI
jgi:glycosyltransferase involved in cell wall biosynthesis